MKCINPFIAFVPWDTIEGESNIIWAEPGQPLPSQHTKYTIPCRKCIPCRIKHAGQWVVRLLHESQVTEQPPLFITLTYNDENLPDSGSLNHKHYQDFMKRLRKAFPNNTIRFFMCGEYGEQTFRPHYHAIIFGLQLDDLTHYRTSHAGDKLYKSDKLESIWKLGYVVIGFANKSTMAYTAGYLLKNQITREAREEDKPYLVNPKTAEIIHGPNIESQLTPSYIRMSTNPGIGANWVDQYANDLTKDYFTVEGKRYGLPTYYLRRVKEHHPDVYSAIMELREERNQESEEKAIEWERNNQGTYDDFLKQNAINLEKHRRGKKQFFKPVQEKKL